MRTELGTLDRLTLTTWRLANETGWTVFAFASATAAHLLLTSWLQDRRALGGTSAFNLNARAGAEDGVDNLIAKFGLRIALTILLAVFVGAIVGRRVWRRQALYATVAAAGYVLYTLLWIEYSAGVESYISFSDGIEQHIIRRTTLLPALLYDSVLVATIPFAGLVAHRAVRRRPEVPASFDD